MVNYEYAVVYSGQKDPAVAQTMQAFLNWAVTDGSAPSFLDQEHMQPLPAAVAKLSDAPDRQDHRLKSLQVSIAGLFQAFWAGEAHARAPPP